MALWQSWDEVARRPFKRQIMHEMNLMAFNGAVSQEGIYSAWILIPESINEQSHSRKSSCKVWAWLLILTGNIR